MVGRPGHPYLRLAAGRHPKKVESNGRCGLADDLGTILDQILSVKKSLREVPADAFVDRIELRERLLGLQAAAAAAGQETSTASTLHRYVEQLVKRRDALLSRRIDPSWEDGSLGGTGIPGEQTDRFNRRIDEAARLPALGREIARVRARLAGSVED